MGKVKVIGTGLNGLIGSRVIELLRDEYEFVNLSRQTGVDILKKNDVLNSLKQSEAKVVLHLAAKTDVDGCEKDKDLDIKILEYKDLKKKEEEWGKKQTAWAVNVFGTKNIIHACQLTEKKLIYVSTDFVFGGNNSPIGGYTEETIPNPVNWYGQTKYEAEKIVVNSKVETIIARIAYPYRSNYVKNDFARSIISRFKKKEEIKVIEDHIFTPTFIDDIAFALKSLIDASIFGIYHLVGSQFLTPYEAAFLIADIFSFDKSLINKTTKEEYFKGRAERPFDLSLKNDKIKKLGVRMKTFREGLLEVKRQIS